MRAGTPTTSCRLLPSRCLQLQTSLPSLSRFLPTETTKASVEQTIERGLNSFVEVGEALAKVRDLRLYRDEYGTFEELCASTQSRTTMRLSCR